MKYYSDMKNKYILNFSGIDGSWEYHPKWGTQLQMYMNSMYTLIIEY